mmetsp:Transcript_30264/g.77160  ORF Transcript_30264/g.77160 Transcript_30264/m.77160 type:complete len:291 (+) Transcript_30264:1992-2864(+)
MVRPGRVHRRQPVQLRALLARAGPRRAAQRPQVEPGAPAGHGSGDAAAREPGPGRDLVLGPLLPHAVQPHRRVPARHRRRQGHPGAHHAHGEAGARRGVLPAGRAALHHARRPAPHPRAHARAAHQRQRVHRVQGRRPGRVHRAPVAPRRGRAAGRHAGGRARGCDLLCGGHAARVPQVLRGVILGGTAHPARGAQAAAAVRAGAAQGARPQGRRQARRARAVVRPDDVAARRAHHARAVPAPAARAPHAGRRLRGARQRRARRRGGVLRVAGHWRLPPAGERARRHPVL